MPFISRARVGVTCHIVNAGAYGDYQLIQTGKLSLHDVQARETTECKVSPLPTRTTRESESNETWISRL